MAIDSSAFTVQPWLDIPELGYGAIVITENEFTINKINDVLKNLINHQEKLEKMSSNASNLATLNATKNLANLIK